MSLAIHLTPEAQVALRKLTEARLDETRVQIWLAPLFSALAPLVCQALSEIKPEDSFEFPAALSDPKAAALMLVLCCSNSDEKAAVGVTDEEDDVLFKLQECFGILGLATHTCCEVLRLTATRRLPVAA